MKTAILQCFQQFSSKNSKNVYHDQIIKKLKLKLYCKFGQNVRFTLLKTRSMKTAILHSLQQFSSKNSKTLHYDQIIKKLKLQCYLKIVQNVCFSL